MVKIFIKTVIVYFLQVVIFLILARAILSWFVSPQSQLYGYVYTLTEPILEPCRRLLEKFNLGGYVDFSPILAILIIEMIIRLVY